MSYTNSPQNYVAANGIGVITDANLNAAVQLVPTAAAARGFIPISSMTIMLQGIAAPNDSLGGIFYWVVGNYTDDGENTLVPSGAIGQGAWVRITIAASAQLGFASPPPIGNITPNSGAFTTLSAKGTVSGSGFTALFGSPPAIGGGTAASGTFTTLSASEAVVFTGPDAGLTVTASLVVGQRTEVSSSIAADPAYSFTIDLTTGMYLPAVGQLGLSAAGVSVADYGATTSGKWTFPTAVNFTGNGPTISNNLFVNGLIEAASGSVTNPSITFQSDTTTGLHLAAAGAFAFSAAGVGVGNYAVTTPGVWTFPNEVVMSASGTGLSVTNALAVGGQITVNGNSGLIAATYYFTGTPAATAQVFFLATRAMAVIAVSEVHAVAAGGTSTLTVTHDTGTAAPGAGTSIQTGSFNLNATANTVQSGTLSGTPTLAAGDRLAVNFADAIQSSSGIVVTVMLAPQ